MKGPGTLCSPEKPCLCHPYYLSDDADCVVGIDEVGCSDAFAFLKEMQTNLTVVDKTYVYDEPIDSSKKKQRQLHLPHGCFLKKKRKFRFNGAPGYGTQCNAKDVATYAHGAKECVCRKF